MQETTLRVTGVTCMGCVNSVKRVLTALEGVARVDVQLDPGRVTVAFDPGRVSLQSVRQAIMDAGYQVED